MWPISMPRAIDNPAAALGAQVAVADLNRADLAVGLEVSATHYGRSVPAVGVGAGDPRTARHHERVDQVADAEFLSRSAARCSP